MLNFTNKGYFLTIERHLQNYCIENPNDEHMHGRVVTRTFSDGRTDGQSDDGRGSVRDLDAL
jgi:hypothetical protein